MKTTICKEEDHKEKEIAEALRNGAIAAFPTDTVYGLGALYTDREAVRKIFAAKGRDEGKPLSVLISDISQVAQVAAGVPEEAEKLMNVFWPGALTIILKKNDTVPQEVAAGGDTIGIRMPARESTRALIREVGAPLAAPSANTSGKRSAVTAEDVLEDLDGKIDFLIDGGACEIGISSTVIDMSRGEVKILREGTVTREMIANELTTRS